MVRVTRLTVVLICLLCAVVSLDAQRARARRIRPGPPTAVARTCLGTTYYVRTDGNNANSGTANTAGGAWATIDKGYDTAVAGDCVRVQAGTYLETPTPGHSGSAGNPITVVADGAVTACGLNFSVARSYVRTIGLTLDPTGGGCSANPVVAAAGTNTGLEFWNVAIASNATGDGVRFYNGASSSCDKCIFIGGSVHNIGGGTSTNTAMLIYGNDNFVGYVDFATVCYLGIQQAGNRPRVVNVNFSGFLQCGGAHPDFFYPDGAATSIGFSNGLVESVFGIGTVTSNDNKFAHQSNQSNVGWNDNVWRFNVAYNLGAAFYSVYGNGTGCPSCGPQARLRFYNNTLVNCQQANTGNANCGNINLDATGTNTVWIYNDLFYEGWGSSVTTNIAPWTESAGTITKDYNLAFDPDGSVTFQTVWTNQAHEQSNVDPKLNNVAGQDFTLQSASFARGAGTALTTATSCSGTTLNVATDTGSLFLGDNSSNLSAYGGKLVPGDTITVNSTQYVVSSLSGDALTLTSSISCANGDAVYYGASSTIDIGAYPYKAGGYTLSATKSCAGGTCTITPNDASLVRFVVCYEAGVPYTVINASPYTCANPTGTLEARVYPRYATQTLYVVAQ